MLRIQAELH